MCRMPRVARVEIHSRLAPGVPNSPMISVGLSVPKTPYLLSQLNLLDRLGRFRVSCPRSFSCCFLRFGKASEVGLRSKLRSSPSAINYWSCSVLPMAVSLISARLIVSSGFGSPSYGTTGGRHCSSSSPTPSSLGTDEDSACIGDGRAAIHKVGPACRRKSSI